MEKGDSDYTKEKMEEIANDIIKSLYEIRGVKMGFSLIVFELNATNKLNYISNANKKDMLEAHRKIAKKLEAELNP